MISNKMFLDNSALNTTHLFGCTSRPGNDERDKMVLDSMTQSRFFTKAALNATINMIITT